ncbi:MAG TPA: transglutaminase-like cysteine peptidase [Methylocystis sp.]|nr:transglutaminase-like cysteine peptidase [Methylocystis sp.]
MSVGVARAVSVIGLILLSLELCPPLSSARASEPRSTFALVGEPTSIPYGWIDFCGRQPQECNQPSLEAQNIKLTRAIWAALDGINREVNASIEPMSNLDHWGTITDHWDYPVDGKGDCKIYALQKRKLLIDIGFPRQALLMTIVRDKNNAGHAILTVVTNMGDFILDNLTDEIRPWEATGYRFIKRQSQEDPNTWVSILGSGSGRS